MNVLYYCYESTIVYITPYRPRVLILYFPKNGNKAS